MPPAAVGGPDRILRPLVLVWLAFVAASASAQSIPPGQEDVLAAMLGSGVALPDGCALADGQVDHAVVRATYHCPSGDVRIQLSHPTVQDRQAIRTERFALSVIDGSPPGHLLGAVEALVRSKEADFQWSMLSLGANSRGFASAVLRLPLWCFGLLLLGLASVASISGWRAWSARGPRARGAALEALIVAVVVVIWLQIHADPPAHGDTAVDVALARDCLASSGASCLGHAASAIGLVQGQGFTYALAVWLYLGLSMRALCFVAACVNGAAIGLLHYATSRRFGGVAWVVSACASALGPYMTGYPTIWNPSWFVLPLTIAFLAALAIADGGGIWSAFVAGVALAITSESHLLFGTFLGVAVVIALITGRRGIMAATVLLASFVLTEIVISPVSSSLNALILGGWLRAHLVPTMLVGVVCVASIPMQRWLRHRLMTGRRELRDLAVVAVWLSGGVGIGLVLPWAVSRPVQIRYYGAAFPSAAYAVGWLLDAATLRARSWWVWAASVAVFAAIFCQRMVSADFAKSTWFMDDGMQLVTTAGLANTSALDIQMIVRALPNGPVGEVAAAFAGTADFPAFPPRIVRAVRPRGRVALPDGWARVELAHGEILVGEIGAWTHPEEAAICPEPASGGACLTLTRDDFNAVALDAGGDVHRVFGLRLGRSATQIGKWAEQGTQSLVWKIPVRAAGTDDTHEIFFCEGPGEQIVTVEGTAWTARDRNRAVVARPAPEVVASIMVRTPIAGKFEAGVPPMPMELREDEAGVLRGILPP